MLYYPHTKAWEVSDMMPRPASCCFSGHRPEKLPWGENENDGRCLALKSAISALLEELYSDGYRHFICGMAQGCDTYFCEAVLALRGRVAGVTLEAAIPCLSQSDRWSAPQQARYRGLVAQCDYESVVQERYDAGCMHRRNRYMVDHAALLLAVHDGSRGGTYYTIEYALRHRRDVLVLPVPTATSACSVTAVRLGGGAEEET